MSLSAAEQLGCEDGIFLAPILRAHEDDGLEIGAETLLAVRALKQGIHNLRTSEDPYVQKRVASINESYFIDDGIWYENEVPGFKPGRNLLGNMYRANASQIVQFAESYNDRVRELQNALWTDGGKLADDVLERTHTLIGKNLLPKTAEHLMEKTVAWAGEFEAIGSVEQAANSYIGYCHDGGIGIANLYEIPGIPSYPGVAMHQTVFHEYVHGVGHLQSNKRGLFFGLTSRRYSNYNRWLEEAYAATIAKAAVKPDLKNALVKPHQPYSQERRFMKLAIEFASAPVDLSDLSAAHFSYRSKNTKVRKHVAQALGDGLNDLFPEYEGHAWEHINHEYDEHGHREDKSNYMGRLIMVAQSRLNGQSIESSVA